MRKYIGRHKIVRTKHEKRSERERDNVMKLKMNYILSGIQLRILQEALQRDIGRQPPYVACAQQVRLHIYTPVYTHLYHTYTTYPVLLSCLLHVHTDNCPYKTYVRTYPIPILIQTDLYTYMCYAYILVPRTTSTSTYT